MLRPDGSFMGAVTVCGLPHLPDTGTLDPKRASIAWKETMEKLKPYVWLECNESLRNRVTWVSMVVWGDTWQFLKTTLSAAGTIL